MFGIFDKLTEFFKDMLLGGIKANLESMFLDINDKVGVIATDVGKTPMGWNGEVYNFIKNINDNVIVPIAGLIITAVLCIELINMVMQKNNMHDTDTFEFFKYIIKMFIAVYLSGDQIVAMVDTLKEKEIGELLMILVETSLVRIAIQCISLTITLIVYGRMFEIYVYSSVSSIPFATMGNKEWGQIGTNYIKGLFALGLQGLFLMVCLGINTVLIRTVQITDIHASLFSILGYALLLGLMMFKSGTVAKSIMNTH